MTTPINTSIFCQTVASAAFGLAVVGGTSSDAWSQHAPQAIAAELTAARDPTEVYGPGYRLVEGEGYRDAAGRVPVSLGLRLIQLSDIDSKEETFTVEGVLYLTWSDDWGSKLLGWSEGGVDRKLAQVAFRPVPEFENGLGTRDRYSLLMAYTRNGERTTAHSRARCSTASFPTMSCCPTAQPRTDSPARALTSRFLGGRAFTCGGSCCLCFSSRPYLGRCSGWSAQT